MVEIMVVVAILSILFTLVMVATAKYRVQAANERTRALIQRLDLALGDYYNKTGAYPPDGFDNDVTTEDGDVIKGSACLHYFLTRELEVTTEVAGEQRKSKHPPAMDFKQSELEEADEPGIFEIVDGFGTPIHYDNTQNGEFTPQTGEAHMIEPPDHPIDPRESVEYGAVKKEGIQTTSYDIWAHGVGRHTVKDEMKNVGLTISNWNLGTGEN